jgi:acyl phosphate:glycerol-3-phosphate acyltransferase
MLLAQVHPLVAAGAVAAGYLLGTLPTALVVARRRGVDPTAAGSGNPGATNVARTAGRTAGILTLAGDVAKGAAAAGLGWAVAALAGSVGEGDGRTLAIACGTAAVVGHVAPLTRRFRGGKGVASGAGMATVAVPLAALLAGAVFALVAVVGRRASLASITGTAALPVAAAATGATAPEVAVLAAGAALIVTRHRANVRRLLRGTEPRFGAGRPGH